VILTCLLQDRGLQRRKNQNEGVRRRKFRKSGRGRDAGKEGNEKGSGTVRYRTEALEEEDTEEEGDRKCNGWTS
jgi:hypothetical protein